MTHISSEHLQKDDAPSASQTRRILVTGSRGFVGRNLLPALQAQGYSIQELNRSDLGGRWDGATNFSELDLQCDTLIHLAARVHVMNERECEATLELYREANVRAFHELLKAAAAQGLKRVIYLSTSKVLAEESLPGAAITDDTRPEPRGSYAVSKRESEQMLQEISKELSLEFLTLRPPLIYGRGVKANFLALAKAVQRDLPVPVPAEANRRSLLSVENLASAILHALQKEHLPNREFLISDGISLSTEELVTALGKIFQKDPKVVRIPRGLSRIFLATPFLKKKWSRLSGSFEIQASGLEQWLQEEWRPIPTGEALRKVFARG